MLQRLEARHPNAVFRIGMGAFLVASVGSYVVRRIGVAEPVADPVNGFLYGVAIATMLLGLRLRTRAGGRGA